MLRDAWETEADFPSDDGWQGRHDLPQAEGL